MVMSHHFALFVAFGLVVMMTFWVNVEYMMPISERITFLLGNASLDLTTSLPINLSTKLTTTTLKMEQLFQSATQPAKDYTSDNATTTPTTNLATTSTPSKAMVECPPHDYKWNEPSLMPLLGIPYFVTILRLKPPKCYREDGYTLFENGTIRVNPAFNSTVGLQCIAKCVHRASNIKIRFGPTCHVGDNCTEFACDFVLVNCDVNGSSVHIDIHMQIFEYTRNQSGRTEDFYRPSLLPSTNKNNIYQPNVYILVLDSAGRYPALRQLNKTYTFMIDEMGAIDFTRYNHVGYTSRDNALPAFSGIIGEKADRSLFGGTILESSFKCKQFLDNQSHILFEFEHAGYETMFAQDYFYDLYAYMDCLGYKNDFAKHLFRPFVITALQDPVKRRTWSQIVERELLKKHLLNPENCGRMFHHVLRYLQRFIDSYKDSPKIAIAWTNEGHEGEKGFRASDHHYEKFLRDNREKLKDAFLIVMGDHGQKGGKIGDTEQGQVENLTPLMLFSVPQKLRNTSLEAIVRKNANEVLTPHDLYATLIDIVRNQPQLGFRDTNYVRINATLGNSWLRELDPDLPRDCQHLPIPAQYCPCNYYTSAQSIDRGFKISRKLIEENFEAYLRENNVQELCEMIRVENITKIRQVLQKERLIAIRVEFFTVRDAKFMVTFGIQSNGSLFMKPRVFVRLNR